MFVLPTFVHFLIACLVLGGRSPVERKSVLRVAPAGAGAFRKTIVPARWLLPVWLAAVVATASGQIFAGTCGCPASSPGTDIAVFAESGLGPSPNREAVSPVSPGSTQDPSAPPTRQDSTISVSNRMAQSQTPALNSKSNLPGETQTPGAADAPGASAAAGNSNSDQTSSPWNGQTVHRLLALVVGVSIVLFGILGLRLNAFLALIVAALVVSLMGPGEWTGKISRVGAEFGASAGKIGLAIALAAVIGQSLMASGAAERIVLFFMRLLGEERTPLALCGSGYVLGIPVFFDTVFYLLIPLARSMYLRTRKRYLAGLLAIAAGGAITHTLVPPTPGPLLVASNLGVNLGTMMMVGALVAMVSAVAGLTFATLADRFIKVPVRWLEDSDTVATPGASPNERTLPPLWLSALPLLLPVLMIAGSTVFGTLADNQQRAKFSADAPQDFSALAQTLVAKFATQSNGTNVVPSENAVRGAGVSGTIPSQSPGTELDQATDPLSRLTAVRVLEHLSRQEELKSPPFRSALQDLADGQGSAASIATVTSALNDLLDSRDFYQEEMFRGVAFSASTQKLLGKNRSQMPLAQLQRLNRLLLEDSLRGQVAPHQWQTPLRTYADWAGMIGDPSLALLVAAIVALLIEKRQRQVGWAVLGLDVEKALASAGVIILITAAGGAFGAMLTEAKVGDAIREIFAQYSETGLGLLVLAFLISSVLKFAQGSSTVAMITASGMLATVATPETLGCHPVYMATAIGGGSLFGSWMNDSGFWIFTKMGDLTTAEGLKTWTPCLAILGLTAGLTTLLLAWLMPLI